MKKYLLLMVVLWMTHTGLSQVSWEPSGPCGGRVEVIASSDDGTLYAGFPYNGYPSETTNSKVYRSDDQGGSWQKLSLEGQAVGEIEAYGSHVYAIVDSMLHASADHGDTWSESLAVESFHPTILTKPGGFVFVGGEEFWASDDYGATWVERTPRFNTWLIEVDTSGNLYAVTDSIYRSADNGQTWTPLGASPGAGSIAINESGDIFIGTNWEGIYRSSDNGATFVMLNNFYEVNEIEIDTAGRIYINTYFGYLYTSADNGNTWVHINQGLSSLYTTDLVVDVAGNLFVGTEDGIFWSADNGLSFEPRCEGFHFLGVTSLARGKEGVLLASTRTMIYRSEDRGDSWEVIHQVAKETDIMKMKAQDNGDIFIITVTYPYDKKKLTPQSDSCMDPFGYYCRHLWRSTDNGDTWTELYNSFGIADWDVNSDGRIFVASGGGFFSEGGGLVSSSDNGETWELMNENFSCCTRIVTIDSQDNLYVVYKDTIHGSTDNGLTWSPVVLPIPQEQITFVKTNSLDHLFVVTKSNTDPLYATVRRSDDNGDSWETVYMETGVVINQLLVGLNDRLYLATTGGLYQSTDNGISWSEITGGLPVANIVSVAQDPSGYLYSAPNYQSVWRSDALVSARNLMPGEALVIFPNPANGSVTISYNGGSPGSDEVRVHNIHGKLVKRVKVTGTTMSLDVSGMAPGVYILSTGGMARKLVVY